MARGTHLDSLARIDAAFAGALQGGSEICYRRKNGSELWSAILISLFTMSAVISYDRLHHFISDGLWDAAPLETELARQADRIVGASDAFLVIDEQDDMRVSRTKPEDCSHRDRSVDRDRRPVWHSAG